MKIPGKTAREVALDLEAAYRLGPACAADVLTGALAEQVTILHEPRLPSDGLRNGAEMRKGRMAENPAFEKALEGFDEVALITVEGDVMTIRKTMTGTRRSTGEAISETVESRFRVRDGEIVEMLAVSQSASFSLLGDILREGGYAP